jgi:hypothetical protein
MPKRCSPLLSPVKSGGDPGAFEAAVTTGFRPTHRNSIVDVCEYRVADKAPGVKAVRWAWIIARRAMLSSQRVNAAIQVPSPQLPGERVFIGSFLVRTRRLAGRMRLPTMGDISNHGQAELTGNSPVSLLDPLWLW